MLIDDIANRNSLRKINPIEKVIFSIGLLVTMTICDSYLIHIFDIIAVNLFLIFLVKISLRDLFKLYKAVLFFIILTNISFLINGTEVVLLTIKAIDSISIVYFMFCTTPVTQLAIVMKKLRFPQIVIELFLLIYRFIFLFTEVKNQFVIAQKSRLGFSSLKKSYNSLALIVSNMLYKMIIHSDNSNIAVKSRLGEDYLFMEEKFGKNRKMGYLYLYLFLMIVVVIYDKI